MRVVGCVRRGSERAGAIQVGLHGHGAVPASGLGPGSSDHAGSVAVPEHDLRLCQNHAYAAYDYATARGSESVPDGVLDLARGMAGKSPFIASFVHHFSRAHHRCVVAAARASRLAVCGL